MSEIDVFNSLKAKLISIRKDIATNPGSVVADSNLIPQAFELNKNRTLLSYSRDLQTFIDILALENDEATLQEIADVQNKTVDQVLADISAFIDNRGADFDMIRQQAVYSSGYAYFGRFDAPTFDITIPLGTQIKTQDNKTFETTAEVTMYATGAESYYDAVENLYLVKVPIKATQAGVIGNVVSYTISVLVNQVSGINYVLNKDNITNGLDKETDTQFIARIKTKLSGVNTATKGGLKNLIMANFPTIRDMVVIDSNDSLMVRDQGYGGAVDVYVLEETSPITITSESYPAPAFNEIYSTFNAFYLTKQPVFFDGVTETVTGVSIADFHFVEDLTSTLAHSKFGRSLVYFTNPGLTPPFLVTYQYYKICEDIQNFMNLEWNAIVGSIDGSVNPNDVTILVRKAISHSLNIEFKLVTKPGYTAATVKNEITLAITNYIASTLLGARISQSDITAVAEAVEGTDYIYFSALTPVAYTGIFDLDTSGLLNTVSVIKTEYIRAGTITILL